MRTVQAAGRRERSPSVGAAATVVEHPQIQSSVVPRWLSIHEASLYICATHWFTEELCRQKKIPYVLNGKRFVIDRQDLDAYMLAHKVVPVTEGEVLA